MANRSETFAVPPFTNPAIAEPISIGGVGSQSLLGVTIPAGIETLP